MTDERLEQLREEHRNAEQYGAEDEHYGRIVLECIDEIEKLSLQVWGMTGERDDERRIAVGWQRKHEEAQEEIELLRSKLAKVRSAVEEAASLHVSRDTRHDFLAAVDLHLDVT